MRVRRLPKLRVPQMRAPGVSYHPRAASGRQVRYYHGTASPLSVGQVIHPAARIGRRPNYAGESDTSKAYATNRRSDAWNYAEKAWHAGDRGHPRVYEVVPLGAPDPDPTTYADGRSRGNNPSDQTARGWRVVREVPMPRSMGTPADWR